MGRSFITNINPGDRFGKLEVVKCVGYPNFVASHINYYLCKCDCGNEKTIRRNHLTSGKTISCGCVRRAINSKPPGEVSYNALYSICRESAKSRDLPFTLSREQHKSLVIGNCSYCGKPPEYYNNTTKKDGSLRKQGALDKERAAILANGVDRVDSKKGYVFTNCVPCCSACNRAKWEMTAVDFIAHCRRIITYQDSICSK